MGWLIDNPVSDMYGPTFLFVYLVSIVAAISICDILLGTVDRSSRRPRLTLPMTPDPYEIAYLRGGENEVARLIVIDLLACGALIQSVRGPIVIAVDGVSLPGHLADVGRPILEFFVTARSPHELFTSRAVPHIKQFCRGYSERMAEENLLLSDVEAARINRNRAYGVLFLLAFAGYKLMAALTHGHTNVGFLVLMAIVGSIALAWLCRPRRLSIRGRNYLKDIQAAFQSLSRPRTAVRPGLPYNPAVVAVGLFGFESLLGTPHVAYARTFRMAASASGCSSGTMVATGSTCGSGGGGGDGGGGGTGGGCGGGGGGGGCGGCGGGG